MKNTTKKTEPVSDTEYTEIETEMACPRLDGFSEENARALKKLMYQFLSSYSCKENKQSDVEWLRAELQRTMPDEKTENVQDLSREIVAGVSEWNANQKSLHEAILRGSTEEEWLSDRLQDAAIGMSLVEYGNYLSSIDAVMSESNQALMDTILTKSNTISMNPNLDGFLAEQEIVSSFNSEAVLQNSPYRAQVLKPQMGDTYGKNSVDIVIRDTRKNVQNIVRRYQAKFGGSAEKTADYLLGGDYRGQRALVPKGQTAAVKKTLFEAGSKHTVSDYIESPDGVQSKSFTKDRVMQHRDRVQAGDNLRKASWTTYNIRELSISIGREAAFAGVAGAAIGTGFYMAHKVCKGEEITADEVVEVALTTGTDVGIKTAVAGALTAGVRRGLVPIIPKGTPAGVLVTVASVGIENAKIVAKYVKGELSGKEAIDSMARISIAMTAGLGSAAIGAGIGATIGSVIPVIGTVIGGFVGGTVGYIAGSKVGNAIYSGARKIASVAKNVVSSVWKAMKTVGHGVKNFLSGIFT